MGKNKINHVLFSNILDIIGNDYEKVIMTIKE